MPHILVIVMYMKLGGPVVSMQEFTTYERCNAALTVLTKKLENPDMQCIAK